MKLSDEKAHRRALADVNGDPVRNGWLDLLALAMFVLGVIALIAIATGHIEVRIH